MYISALLLIAASLHPGAFVSCPQSVRFSVTFLYISVLLYFNLRRLGLDAPGLLPTKKEEPPL